MMTRTEKDLKGEKQIPADALWGIHTARAVENFPLSGYMIHPALIKAYGEVKLACAQINAELGYLEEEKASAIIHACIEMSQGLLNEHIITDSFQGGAGTSVNMNVNEVLANRALLLCNRKPGDYQFISPLNNVNLHQSTNDTYPTSLKIAAIRLLRQLEQNLIKLQEAFQQKEKEFSHIVKIGRTQLQDAVLTTLGREMGAYAEAFNRDRWRVYKCEERLRVVNLGGTAIGTGLGAPRKFIFKAVDRLRENTGIGLSRAENLIDNTQNADVYAEVSGILTACVTNLIKSANDLRLMSSGPGAGFNEINLPEVQTGSSIMPGKINPVIPEAIIQVGLTINGNHQIITQAAASGNLELNQFLPLIACKLLESIDLLSSAILLYNSKCVSGITANEDICKAHIENSTAVITALVPRIGYKNAESVIQVAEKEKISIKEAADKLNLVSKKDFDELISPESVCKFGY